ncbi:NAD-dependent epimerase/dehydratase family protein [Nonomuraea terrae]|uniref:NAD-dependent epimerase/dehydratase family protein n=1 Tax=Nonomuraea terrae TaxID=2530383 RepID=A0A4R4YM87_9ACTN|nr:NAD(P)H-binding protein [Nonomuraea terrae]TDD46076.1 NAD-dependent epimerase/dehydratase family protein [Nonomuraea terrae]
MPILVTGATGTVGRSLVRQLLEAGQEVRALTRFPENAALPPEAELVRGDLGDPASLTPALRGVERMHLVAIDGSLAAGARLIELAERAGVRRITHLGHNDPSAPDDDPMEAGHRALHRVIEGSGLEWTHVFPGEFMANTLDWAPSIKAAGEVRAPFGGWTNAMVHEADIAAVLTTALLEDGHAGRTYWPTGPEPVRRADAVRLIGEASGREIRFVELTPAQAREEWKDTYPPEVIEWFLQLGDYLNDAEVPISPDVEKVTGRTGRTFAQWAADHADDFR